MIDDSQHKAFVTKKRKEKRVDFNGWKKKSENSTNGRLFPKKRMEKRVDLTGGDIGLTGGFNEWRYRINEWI